MVSSILAFHWWTVETVFGEVLRFGTGTDHFLQLENYINIGASEVLFSMWYRYDTTIVGDKGSAVLLQHQGKERSLFTLRADGKYHTFINGKDVISENAVFKGNWQHVTVQHQSSLRQLQ